jgi:hypothetical protein
VSRLLRTHWLIVVVLVLGTAMRLGMLLALPLPLMQYTDANVYVRAAQEFLFRPEEGRTAGYPLFLRTAHGLSGSVTFPIVLQHLLGLAAALGIYVIGLATRVPRTLAALAAAVWALSGDWLWLEHQLLTEVVGTVLLVAAIVVVVLSRRVTSRGWVVAVVVGLVVAGLAMGAGFTRPALFAALPGVGLCILLLTRLTLLQRLTSAAVLVVACGMLLVGYLQVQESKTNFSGLVGSSIDLGSYPGIAPLAECPEFRVPRGTSGLCERSDPDTRPGSDYYYWDPTSPGRRLLARRPDLAPAIKLWAQRATSAEGDAIWETRFDAFGRLFGLGGLKRRMTDQGIEIMSLDGSDVRPAGVTVDAIKAYYGPDSAPNKPAGAPYGVLVALQPWTRVSGVLLLALLLVTVAGVAAGRGIARRAAVAIGATGWIPALYGTWAGGQFNWRYVVPSVPLIALAGMAAIAALLWRRESSRRLAAGASGGAAEEPASDVPAAPAVAGPSAVD